MNTSLFLTSIPTSPSANVALTSNCSTGSETKTPSFIILTLPFFSATNTIANEGNFKFFNH